VGTGVELGSTGIDVGVLVGPTVSPAVGVDEFETQIYWFVLGTR